MSAMWAAFKGSKVAMYAALAAAFVWGLLVLVSKLMSAGAAKEQAAQAERNDETRRPAAGPGPGLQRPVALTRKWSAHRKPSVLNLDRDLDRR